MKNLILAVTSGFLLAGCAATENGRVYTYSNGTTGYGLNQQPEANVSGQGPLMPGTAETRQMQTGQFTGQERTQDVVGQPSTLPQKANVVPVEHSAAPAVGAGSLGQSGISPGADSVRGPDLLNGPVDTRNAATDIHRAPGVGGAPGAESGSVANVPPNNITIPNKSDQ